MKPNFALSLSSDGIVLLQRSAAGWRTVGEADPASDRLSAELAVLRRTATALSQGGVRCKLIIPNDQIRYMSIDTPGMTAEARRKEARAALDGATPYAVDELAFDIDVDGDKTHVAAVALETLDEAEAFATEHRLHPVCFAARPEADCGFASEAFFGPTKAAKALLEPGEEVERDSSAFLLTPETEAEADDADKGKDGPSTTDEGETPPAPGFVSRRRVPTFRTEAAGPAVTAGSVPGFGETEAPYAAPAASARKPARDAADPATGPVARRAASEAERLTIFGMTSGNGLSGRMGLAGIALLVLVVVLAGVIAFAGGATSGGLAALLARFSNPEPEVQFTAPLQPASPVEQLEEPVGKPQGDAQVTFAALDDKMTDEDAAVLDALRAPAIEPPAPVEPPRGNDWQSAYPSTGIWPIAPDVPEPPGLVDLDDLYVTSIDPINPNFDAVALPDLKPDDHDQAFPAPASPAPAGTVFTLDERGMVVPTASGSMNPDGILVFAAPPPARPPTTLVKVEEPGEDLSLRLRLAGYRPVSRPDDLIESNERATFSGLTRSELGALRPRLRPASPQENALAAASLVPLDDSNSRALLAQPDADGAGSATARAIVASLRPDARPRDFEATVSKALESEPAAAPAAPRVTAVAPRTVAPKIPSSASASREATVKNAINLRQVNLIGVYGTPSSRRALVRLGNGSYRKVEVGDKIDGGQVSAIGDSELRYQKSGRSIVLKMPRG